MVKMKEKWCTRKPKAARHPKATGFWRAPGVEDSREPVDEVPGHVSDPPGQAGVNPSRAAPLWRPPGMDMVARTYPVADVPSLISTPRVHSLTTGQQLTPQEAGPSRDAGFRQLFWRFWMLRLLWCSANVRAAHEVPEMGMIPPPLPPLPNVPQVLRPAQIRGRTKPPRNRFTIAQTAALESSFVKSKYVSIPERTRLSLQCKLTETQVRDWFRNRRERFKKKCREWQRGLQ